MKNFMNEFKKFICRGNVMDMAVGIIIGGAFTAIVNSLVTDIINPVLGIFGGMNFDQLIWYVNGAEIAYGKFITAIINFLIMAFVIFMPFAVKSYCQPLRMSILTFSPMSELFR